MKKIVAFSPSDTQESCFQDKNHSIQVGEISLPSFCFTNFPEWMDWEGGGGEGRAGKGNCLSPGRKLMIPS